jgi:hypothetical protein
LAAECPPGNESCQWAEAQAKAYAAANAGKRLSPMGYTDWLRNGRPAAPAKPKGPRSHEPAKLVERPADALSPEEAAPYLAEIMAMLKDAQRPPWLLPDGTARPAHGEVLDSNGYPALSAKHGAPAGRISAAKANGADGH